MTQNEQEKNELAILWRECQRLKQRYEKGLVAFEVWQEARQNLKDRMAQIQSQNWPYEVLRHNF